MQMSSDAGQVTASPDPISCLLLHFTGGGNLKLNRRKADSCSLQPPNNVATSEDNCPVRAEYGNNLLNTTLSELQTAERPYTDISLLSVCVNGQKKISTTKHNSSKIPISRMMWWVPRSIIPTRSKGGVGVLRRYLTHSTMTNPDWFTYLQWYIFNTDFFRPHV